MSQEQVAAPAARSRTTAVAAVVSLVVGLLAGWTAWGMRVGTLSEPGPGLWPLVVSVVMVLSSVALLVAAGSATQSDPFTRGSAVVLLGAVSLVAYAWAFERIGFEIPTALLLMLWLTVIGKEPLLTSLLVTVGATAAAYLLFVVALGVSLPRLIAF
ncbi:tripartite tricarboxylate transporter TctB family protein [Actinomycetes bacterium KLBMP 9759]